MANKCVFREDIESSGSQDKMIKNIKKKFESTGIAKTLKGKRYYIPPYELRKIEEEKSKARQYFRRMNFEEN